MKLMIWKFIRTKTITIIYSIWLNFALISSIRDIKLRRQLNELEKSIKLLSIYI